MDAQPIQQSRIEFTGIKCDAEGCDYSDGLASFDMDNLPEWIGKACPKCGANLLTLEDAESMLTLQYFVRIENLRLEPSAKRELVLVPLAMNGTGRIAFAGSERPMNGTGRIAFAGSERPL